MLIVKTDVHWTIFCFPKLGVLSNGCSAVCKTVAIWHCRFESRYSHNKKRGITSPLFFNLVVINYFFLETIDHTPPASVTAAPISSCTDESVARPFIIRIPPTKVSACLTIPRICSLVILMLIKGLCQSISIGEIGKLSFGLMAGHVVLVHAVEVRILQGQQGVRGKPNSGWWAHILQIPNGLVTENGSYPFLEWFETIIRYFKQFLSSVGRALVLHARCRRFESYRNYKKCLEN